MIDLHAHILPGLDHGPADEEEALEMARQAAGDGITMLAATPHVSFEYPTPPADIRAATERMRRLVEREGIPLEIVVGADYRLTPELVADPRDVITLADNGRYFLLEPDPLVVPPSLPDIVRRFQDRGLMPVITHPERHPQLLRRPRDLEELARLGCPLQLTAGSLTGMFGGEARKGAVRLLREGLCHLLGSDAHWSSTRPPILSPGLAAAEAIVGRERARSLVRDVPLRIMRGEPLS